MPDQNSRQYSTSINFKHFFPDILLITNNDLKIIQSSVVKKRHDFILTYHSKLNFVFVKIRVNRKLSGMMIFQHSRP